jgi:hypothetical protein
MQQNAPFWTKGNQLMYISAPDEKGNAEYVDLSYMLPYEFMLTPARAALQEYQARGMVSDDTLANIARASWEGFSKFVEPFASEALATERVIDVTTRQGRTREGATIYEEGAELGDKLGQSLMHVTGAFIPGIVDQFVHDPRRRGCSGPGYTGYYRFAVGRRRCVHNRRRSGHTPDRSAAAAA